jgi:hypothetical protein
MIKRALFAVAVVGLAASAASANHEYRWTAGSGGGNAQPQYRLVRVENTHRAVDAPYALTGRRTSDRRLQLSTPQGGNGRMPFFVRAAD